MLGMSSLVLSGVRFREHGVTMKVEVSQAFKPETLNPEGPETLNLQT